MLLVEGNLYSPFVLGELTGLRLVVYLSQDWQVRSMPMMRNGTFNFKPGTVFYSKHSIMWTSINKHALYQGCKSSVLTIIKIIPSLSEEIPLTLVNRIKWEFNLVVIL